MPELLTPEQQVISEAFQRMGEEVARLRDRIEALERLDGERAQQLAAQAKKHDDLVAELQTLISQAMAVDPQRAQAIKARAVKIAKIRKAQQNPTQLSP